MAQVRPTFSESWYRVADLKAKLRSSAQISRQFYRGERWYVVRDPAGNQFHRLSSPAYNFIGLLNGQRTVNEAWELVGGQLADDAPTQNEVIQILSQLHSANLLESDVTPDAAILLRRHKKMVRQQWQGRLMNILFPRIPLWDPDTFLCRWMPFMRGLLSKFGAIVWMLVIAAAVFALAPQYTQLMHESSSAMDPANWPFLWATFVLIKFIHEMGHAFSTRRFGGEVHEVGIMFLVLVPAPYVDASSAWSFPNKWQKIFVGAGGMIFELFVAAIMAFVWLATAPGLIHGLAYNAMLIASVSTIIFNANPLLRYDGYYMLSDYLEIPNLRYRAVEYSMGLIKRHLFKVKMQTPLPPPGQRVWLFIYAIASSIYRIIVGVTIILVVAGKVPILGILMSLGGVVTWLVVPVVKTFNYLALEPELHRKRTRATLWTLGAVATAVVLIGFIPFNVHFEAEAAIEPHQRQIVFASQNGKVSEIKVQDGQSVKKGDVLLVCEDRASETIIGQLEDELKSLSAQLGVASANTQVQRNIVEAKIRQKTNELQIRRTFHDQLTVRAPFDGIVIGKEISDLKGKYIKKGEQIAIVADLTALRLRTILEQRDAALIYRLIQQHGGLAALASNPVQAEVRPAGDLVGRMLPKGTSRSDLKATLDSTRLPTANDKAAEAMLLQGVGGGEIPGDTSDPKSGKFAMPQVEIWLDLANADKQWLPGQRAYVQFTLAQKETLAWQWSRRLWQLVQAHSHSKWL